MQERDLGAADTGARLLVDHPQAGGPQIVERARDIIHAVGNVVQARAALGEEPADRRVCAQRRQQLDMALTDVEQRGLHALLCDRFPMHQRHAVRVAVDGDRGVEVLDRHADVVDAAEHDGECTLRVRVRLALAANTASGGGFDPAPLLAVLPGAELFGCDELGRIEAWRPERIAVAGGDGTIGPLAALAGRLDVPLAVIPTGTANDFARAHGLPADPRAAAELAARGRATRPLELGQLADGRPFVNVASAGLASVAAHRAQPLKHRLGPFAYAVGAARAAATAHPLPTTVRADGRRVFAGACWQAIVAVSGAFGGGSGVAEADPHDGVLDVVVLPAGSRIGLARRAWGLRTQTIARQRGVEHARGTVIEVELPDGAELNVDGELRRGGLERVTVRPRAFRLLVPEGETRSRTPRTASARLKNADWTEAEQHRPSRGRGA